MRAKFNRVRMGNLATAVVVCIGLLLPGCSTQSQRIGADDGSDVCHRQRETLDSTGNYFGEDIVTGAAIGAAGGGLIGLLAGGNARSALIGAVAGGALGAAGGYWHARQQQIADQATLYQTVSADIGRDNVVIDKTQAAFDQLVECRHDEAMRIRAALRAGSITRDQAEAAMLTVRARHEQDIRIAEVIDGKIQKRSGDFNFANEQVNPGMASNGPPPAPRRPRAAHTARPLPPTPAEQVRIATSTNVAKRDQLDRSIDVAKANQSAFELS